MKRILIVGAGGQIGSELTVYLRKIYGNDNVIATDVRECPALAESGPFKVLNALDATAMAELVSSQKVDAIFNLVALLSAVGEAKPQTAWQINMGALLNSLEVARLYNCALFTPSSIGAFGPTSPKDKTPQDTVMRPTTMYGVSKVHLELLGEYYHHTQGLDFRSCRYPGIISNKALPGGGTTDYAIDIFYEAIKHHHYTCFLGPDTPLPMMYMPDCLRGTLELIEADRSKLTQCVYNIAAMTFTPAQLAENIKKYMPDFTIDYKPDSRQAIADSWPYSLDDSHARKDWGWKEEYDMDALTRDMLTEIEKKLMNAKN